MLCSMETLNGKALFHTATSAQSWADDISLHTLCLPLPTTPKAVSLSNNPIGLTEQLACCCIVENDWSAIGSDSKERNAVTLCEMYDTVKPHQLALRGKLYLRDLFTQNKRVIHFHDFLLWTFLVICWAPFYETPMNGDFKKGTKGS